MPLTMSHTAEIAAPPERIFDAMTDAAQLRQWMPNLVSFEPLTPGPIGVGSEWKETRKMFGHQATEVFEVTALERPRLLALRVDGSKGTMGKGECLFTYTLMPTGAGTRLTMDAEFRMPGGFFTKFMGKVFGGMMKKACTKDLGCLKAHAEKG